MRQSIALFLAAMMASAAGVSCVRSGGKTVAKQFPEGEPGSASADAGLGRIIGEADPETAQRSTRRISIPGDRQEARGLFLSVQVPAPRVPPGVPIVVNMAVRNTTGNSLPVTYPSAQRFDVVVFADAAQRRPVYMWSQDRTFAQMFEEQMLGPGSTLPRILEVPTTRDTTLRAFDENDLSSPLPPGKYWLYGRHAGTPPLSWGPLEIEVLNPDGDAAP